MQENTSLESIKSMLVQVINKQNEMDKTLREMDLTLTQLNQTVIGNPTYGHKGIISELSEIKDYVEKDKMVKNKLYGGLTVIGVLWTLAFQYITHIFKK